MQIAVVKESFPGERRVALVPSTIPLLTKQGMSIAVEQGAGQEAGYPDDEFADRGAQLIDDRNELLSAADVVLMVRGLGTNPDAGRNDLAQLRNGQTLIAMCDPLGNPQAVQELAQTGVTLFALEMIPRITRAQSMDVLSSMATIAGYKAVLLAANHLPRMFPMLMTAAGTVTAAKLLVIGAGVAGLQAIASARRLGAVVSAYDVRPAAMEQIESLGGKAVALELETGDSEDKGGYAKQLTEAQEQRQRELLAEAMAGHDVCITTAAIPGKRSPLLVTEDALRKMAPGGVVVDLAAERGGNCEATQADKSVNKHNVTVLGPTNLPSEVPGHASQMYAKNLVNLITHLVRDGQLQIDTSDEITSGTMVAHEGHVTNPRIRDLLGLGPLVEPAKDSSDDDDAYELEDQPADDASSAAT